MIVNLEDSEDEIVILDSNKRKRKREDSRTDNKSKEFFDLTSESFNLREIKQMKKKKSRSGIIFDEAVEIIDIEKIEKEEKKRKKEKDKIREKILNSTSAAADASHSLREAPKLTCPICLEELQADKVVTTCGHLYCRECITAAIKADKKCPSCRKKLGPKSFHNVYF